MNNVLYEASIEDSFIYQTLNSSSGVIQTLVKYIKTAAPMDKEYWEEQYNLINKGLISPLSKKVLEAYNKGEIEILYSKETKVGASIPFIIRKKSDGNIVASIFISSFSSIDKEDNLTIPVRQLYTLLESAYIALQMQTNPLKIQRNVTLMKIFANIYVSMIMRILDREYSLILNKVLYEKVQYCVTRFFIERVWGYPNAGLVEAYSSNELREISEFDLDMIKTGYDNFDITSLDKLIEYIKTLSPRMKELTVKYFIEKYVNAYHGGALISLDYLPYVFYVVISVLLGSFLVSQNALNDIVKTTKGINKMYNELAKIL